MLRRLLGIAAELAPAFDSTLLPYPLSCSKPTESVLRDSFRRVYDEQAAADGGVMVFVLEMGAERFKVMAYVRDCLSCSSDVSPWLSSSKYSTVISGAMSMESRLRPLHRYKHISFRELTLEDLQKSRDYWAPWLLSRFLYHTVVCLLNYPLLITLQLQRAGSDSELFRQQTSFYVARHVRWILHFIDFIETRGFLITDPVQGYCAAVVATIEWQLSYSFDDTTATKKRRNIESCRRLIQQLGTSYPLMAEMIGSKSWLIGNAGHVNEFLKLTSSLGSKIRGFWRSYAEYAIIKCSKD